MKKSQWILAGILLLAIILRFWNFSSRIGIGYDGSRDALVAFESARQGQLPLTGSFSSIGPIPFGPWYYWYITAAVAILPTSYAPWIAIASASVALVLIMYGIGSLLINRRFGLFLAALTAISPAQISASTQLQQHALIGMLSGLGIYLFLRQTKKPSPLLAGVWGFVQGAAILVHYQSAGLLLIPGLFFLFYRRWKLFVPFCAGLFFSLFPTLIFEMNNHWFTTRNILDYIFIGQYRIWTSNRWLTFAGVFFPSFWAYVTGLPQWLAATLMVTCCGMALYLIMKRTIRKEWAVIITCFLTLVVMLRYYRGEKFFGYLQFFHPFIFLFTGIIFYRLWMRFQSPGIHLLLITGFSMLLLFPFRQGFPSDPLTTATWQRVSYLQKKYPHEQFAVYKCKDIYDTNNPQALLLLLYMQGDTDENARKIGVQNANCPVPKRTQLPQQLVDIQTLHKESTFSAQWEPLTAQWVWADTARWWFKEQP